LLRVLREDFLGDKVAAGALNAGVAISPSAMFSLGFSPAIVGVEAAESGQ